jgi:uncharacterized tellurite resistance protein B-like protein
MDLKDFTSQQCQVLLDLAVLGMYADGHLSAAEDERVQRLLTAMGITTEYERAAQYDAAVARVSRHSAKPETVGSHARTLEAHFTTPEQRRFVHGILRDLVASDGRVSPQESTFLSALRQALGISVEEPPPSLNG